MRSSRSPFVAFVLAVVLSSTAIAPAAVAMQRDDPRRDDPPIVRVVRLLLKKLHITLNEELGGPHP